MPLGQNGVEHRAADDHARAGNFFGGDLLAPVEKNGKIAAHVAHAGDAVGDEERKDDVAAAGKPIAECGVDVHVPQAGDEEFAVAVDESRVAGELDHRADENGGDAIAFDDDGGVVFDGRGGGIDQRDVRDGDRRGWRSWRRWTLRGCDGDGDAKLRACDENCEERLGGASRERTTKSNGALRCCEGAVGICGVGLVPTR